MLLFIILPSCGDALDGDWEEMKWSYNDDSAQYNSKKQTFTVPAEGATFHISCRNYSSFWFSEPQSMDTQNFNKFKGDWLEASIEKNTMSVTVEPNQSPEPREYKLGVTAGDIFDAFTITQSGESNH